MATEYPDTLRGLGNAVHKNGVSPAKICSAAVLVL